MVEASVAIPAHNEQAVIDRCLEALLKDARPGELEIVVVCNGCTDGTAGTVRRLERSEIQVVELAEASKVAALNAGDATVNAWPRAYVDADVELTTASLRLVMECLRGDDDVLVAAPRPTFALDGRPWFIRAFYRIWADLPYLSDGMVGSGVYALSEAGRARFGDFPAITADDQFVMQRFERHERRTVEGATFIIHPPRRLAGLLALRTRAYRGNAELARSGLAATALSGGATIALLRLARKPRRWPGLAVYVGVNVLAKRRARRAGATRWERDDSARWG